ncbi:hypothetical protein TNIN_444811 [Trichonephila inaurata madagascariensis]|uniref:Uncharacterized protein n=1 Tax=Trichonephila inaurata madagascariensis TaxID=2747483 RepID=A0A8X6YYE4_9ARAC|nr:hypothetical protein TNIN_444811 [Trichonephila inaurata madagascariensis]
MTDYTLGRHRFSPNFISPAAERYPPHYEYLNTADLSNQQPHREVISYSTKLLIPDNKLSSVDASLGCRIKRVSTVGSWYETHLYLNMQMKKCFLSSIEQLKG